MAPRPKTVREDLPRRELAPRARAAVGTGGVGILQAIGAVTALIHTGIPVAAVLLALAIVFCTVTVLLAITAPGSWPRIAAKAGRRPVHGRGLPHDE